MISFSCPQCKSTYRLQDDSRAGGQLPCSKCKYPIRIPPPSPASEVGPRPAAPPSRVSPPRAVAPPVPPKLPVAPRPAPPPIPKPPPVPVRSAVVPPPAPPPVRSAVAPPPVPVRSAAVPPPPPPVAPPPKPPGFKPLPASLVKPAPLTAGAPRWYYEDGLDIVGPMPEAALREAAEADLLRPDARVWSDALDGWQPVVEVFPRLFDGLANRPRADRQTKLAVGLAVAAVAALLLFGVVAAVKGRGKSEPNKPDVAKVEPPAPTPAPPAPTPAPEPDVQLKPAQIMAKFGPSVARVTAGNGSGSGFLAKPNIVVTNAHVVEGGLSTQFKVSFPSGPRPGDQLAAVLIYEDSARDLAILEVQTDLPPLRLAADVVKGEEVVVIGSPGTEPGKTAENSITRGILSAKNEEVFGQAFHRIDAAVNPGNSGGPVFNDRGAVVGVATLRLIDKQQMNYIVPFADVGTAVERAGKVTASDTAALAKRHDAGMCAARMMVGLMLGDELHGLYVERMVDANRQRRDPRAAALQVKNALLGDTQARVRAAVPAEVRAAAQRLSTAGDGAAAEPMRGDLRKVLDAYDESQRLSAGVETYAPQAFIDRQQALVRQINELLRSLPQSAGETKERFERRVFTLYDRLKATP